MLGDVAQKNPPIVSLHIVNPDGSVGTLIADSASGLYVQVGNGYDTFPVGSKALRWGGEKWLLTVTPTGTCANMQIYWQMN